MGLHRWHLKHYEAMQLTGHCGERSGLCAQSCQATRSGATQAGHWFGGGALVFARLQPSGHTETQRLFKHDEILKAQHTLKPQILEYKRYIVYKFYYEYIYIYFMLWIYFHAVATWTMTEFLHALAVCGPCEVIMRSIQRLCQADSTRVCGFSCQHPRSFWKLVI